MEDKIKQLYDLANTIPYIEYYSHEGTDMYKINNPFTNYASDKRVLCPVTDGFEKALDLAFEDLKKLRLEFWGKEKQS